MAFDNSKWAEFDKNYQESIQSEAPESKNIDSVDALLANTPNQILQPDLGRFIPPDIDAILDPQSA